MTKQEVIATLILLKWGNVDGYSYMHYLKDTKLNRCLFIQDSVISFIDINSTNRKIFTDFSAALQYIIKD